MSSRIHLHNANTISHLSQEAPLPFKKYTKKRSWVWDWFEQDPENKYRAVCLYCHQEIFRLDGDRGSPKKLITHVNSKHGINKENYSDPKNINLRLDKLKEYVDLLGPLVTNRDDAIAMGIMNLGVQTTPVLTKVMEPVIHQSVLPPRGVMSPESKPVVLEESMRSPYQHQMASQYQQQHQQQEQQQHHLHQQQQQQQQLDQHQQLQYQYQQQPSSHLQHQHQQYQQHPYQQQQHPYQSPSLSFNASIQKSSATISPQTKYEAYPTKVVDTTSIDPSLAQFQRQPMRTEKQDEIDKYNDLVLSHNKQIEAYNKAVVIKHNGADSDSESLVQKPMFPLIESTSEITENGQTNDIQKALQYFIAENSSCFNNLQFMNSPSFKNFVKTLKENPTSSI